MSEAKAIDLMSVAKDSSLRIHERIKIIKGSDKKINSVIEARAILAIPNSDLIWTDNKEVLPFAKMEASNYLQKHEKHLQEGMENKDSDIVQKGKKLAYTIGQGIKTIRQFADYANNLGKFIPVKY